MASTAFKITEHVIPSQFIREYARATSDGQERSLLLSVKQYTPMHGLHTSSQKITIVGAHGNGIPKELYEPLWEDLQAAFMNNGISIENIWIADATHQGASGIINEEILGNDPSIFDHSRDLLCLVNHFSSQINSPIIGIGHSMGGAQLMKLALIHPRLLLGLLMIEPIVYDVPPPLDTYGPIHASAKRRSCWLSLQDATEYFEQRTFYKKWDRRVQDRWLQYGLRERHIPGQAGSPEVTLATSKDQEVFSYVRANYLSPAVHDGLQNLEMSSSHESLDLTLLEVLKTPLGRTEPLIIFQQLPSLRPDVLYVYGTHSTFLRQPGLHMRLKQRTGSGILGSGGSHGNRVEEVYIDGAGHLVPMEYPKKIAERSVGWVIQQLRNWNEGQQRGQLEWKGKQGKEKRLLDEEFLGHLFVHKRKGTL